MDGAKKQKGEQGKARNEISEAAAHGPGKNPRGERLTTAGEGMATGMGWEAKTWDGDG